VFLDYGAGYSYAGCFLLVFNKVSEAEAKPMSENCWLFEPILDLMT
jgi:hypothetical protein